MGRVVSSLGNYSLTIGCTATDFPPLCGSKPAREPGVMRKTMSADINHYIKELSEFIPEFSDYWASDEAAFNFGSDSTVHGVFSDFSTLVIDQLECGSLEHPDKLFSYIESVVVAGGEPANAACTCFLENILNRVPGPVNPESFVPYLGPHSVKFCRAWDDFTGVKTHGL
ncbi:MAG: hypothetical protein MI794_08795 [Pseudomonadales bacterium]|nr:hypothetical protein [Pseudomonadales bacterium]